MKNAEWTPVMVERTARKIRKIERKTSLSAVLFSSAAGIIISIAFYSLIKILAFGISVAGEPEGPRLVNPSVFYLQLNSMVQVIGKIGAVFLGIETCLETNKMIRKAVSGSINHKELTVPGRSREWMKKAGELLLFLERIETKNRLLSSLLAKGGEIKECKFSPVSGMDDEEKYSLMCEIYELDYLLSLDKGT
jgi:hypothetical protein